MSGSSATTRRAVAADVSEAPSRSRRDRPGHGTVFALRTRRPAGRRSGVCPRPPHAPEPSASPRASVEPCSRWPPARSPPRRRGPRVTVSSRTRPRTSGRSSQQRIVTRSTYDSSSAPAGVRSESCSPRASSTTSSGSVSCTPRTTASRRSGFLHVRHENGRWGVMEIAWRIDHDLTIRDFTLLRCREPERARLESRRAARPVRGIATSSSSLDSSSPAVNSKGCSSRVRRAPLARTLVKSAIRSLCATRIGWSLDLSRALIRERARRLLAGDPEHHLRFGRASLPRGTRSDGGARSPGAGRRITKEPPRGTCGRRPWTASSRESYTCAWMSTGSRSQSCS